MYFRLYFCTMVELAEIFAGSLIVAFSGAMVPGPMLTVVVTKASEQGVWSSFFIVIGHAILEMAVVAAFILGILQVLDDPAVFKGIGIVGGVVLVAMGLQILYAVIRNTISLDLQQNSGKVSGKFAGACIAKGIFVSAINPYWYIWWMRIGAAFLVKSMQYNVSGVSSFFLGHIGGDFIWYILIGAAVSRGRRFFSRNIYRVVLGLCGLFLLYFGLIFLSDFLL